MAAEVLNGDVVYKPIKATASTADGSSQRIIGKFKLNVEYRSEEKSLDLYIVPSLQQELYLGMDFWRLFGIFPKELEIAELNSKEKDSQNPEVEQHALTQDQRSKLNLVIRCFPSFAEEGLGKTDLITHSIDIGNAKPVKQRHFPVSPAVEKEMYAEIDRMLSLDVIEESDSAWSSPIVMVTKPGKVRICLDCRKINSFTEKDAYPLPQISGILSRLPKAEYITSLDLKDAYWQVPLEPQSRDKTAFTVPGRPLYQFKVMPFGLCNATSTMSRLMDKVVPFSLRNEVFIYLDDLLVVSCSFERHIEVLREIALHIKRAGLTINIGKSHFCMRRVRYLGHIIGEGGIRTDPEKVSAITQFPIPKTLRSLRRFMGMCGWYRKFVPNFATLASPLTDLMTTKRRFSLTEAAIKAFEELKSCLTKAPVLRSPDFTKPFAIHCDASKTGVGAVLVQTSEEGDERPVAFISKKLNKSQRNYTVTEQECLAAIVALKHFRAYVEGHEFTIITDHASLKWLMSNHDLNSRLARWALALQRFKFEIKHRKGSLNVVPDFLSRLNEDEVAAIDIEEGLLIDLNSEHFKSTEYKEWVCKVQANNANFPDLKTEGGYVYRRAEHLTGERTHDEYAWKLWVPKELVSLVISRAHNSPMASHGGIHKTIERVRRYYFWPNLVYDIKAYINACQVCKSTKAPNHVLRPPMGKAVETHRVFQRLFVDFLGPYPRSRSGNIGIFIVLDHFSKFVFLKPVRKINAEVVVKYLEGELFMTFGVPETVVSDNGSQFRSEAFQKLMKRYDITHTLTAVHSPQANASERVNRSVLSAIRAYVHPDQKNWDENLNKICCALRSSKHSSIGTTPYYLTFGQHMVTSGNTYSLLRKLNLLEDRSIVFDRQDSFEIVRAEAKKCMQKAHNDNEKRYNFRSREITFNEGQEVFRRNFKQSCFATGYSAKIGPSFVKARVRKKIGNAYYELEDMQGRPLGNYHAKDIRQ